MVGPADSGGQGIGGVVGPWNGREAEEEAHHLLDLLLLGPRRARDGLLDGGGAVLDELDAGPGEGQVDDALRLATGRAEVTLRQKKRLSIAAIEGFQSSMRPAMPV